MINTSRTVNTGYYKRAVGVFKRREDVEDALRALKSVNYDMNRVSLIARHVEDVKGAEEVTDNQGNEASEGAGVGATTGTVLGGLTGFLIGVGVLAIPGVGPILAAGVEISALGSTLAGAGIGAATGGIIGALVGMGIPEERAKAYNERVKAGEYLLMVSGTEDDLRRVESMLRDRHIEEFGIYDAPDMANTETTTSHPVVQPEPQSGRVATKGVVTDTRDINNDGEPEVVVVDKRNAVNQRNQTR
ncbi:histidine kinase [Leptolyngbya sp. FACHB-541]|uniref:histidine kinase n=1 Tax=Leptolyngbya sp. FACHB-541 TaxID=2692810 RepID=UPI0016834EC4|nr:histidine kinase [Leptolyngbya sp. FACHB-541]MBD1996262.1 histidine kinase [Leptolyngbya sp. FACHB-541]